ncbi:hypothetical protein [Methanosarcina sp. Kolksee]|uniref:hypothetical protein n=1 Tax=Methanosarcina sp. Kolksee TaxID=1434099 RepID=UPI00064E3DDB|nr:hypothetical protein [Methanosarcina sp. Kolksee]
MTNQKLVVREIGGGLIKNQWSGIWLSREIDREHKEYILNFLLKNKIKGYDLSICSEYQITTN